MEDNEDEPDDVKKATPVADEIKSGTKDEKERNPEAINKKNKDGNKPSRCDNKNAKKATLAKSEANCCRNKITKESKTPKMMSVLVYSPPCTLPRLEIIPRHCLSKQEYIDILAAPSRKCPAPCSLGKTVIRKIRPISARINELAQPARRLIVSTLKERGETLPPEMISNLVKSIEGGACMTPEQAERYFRDKESKREVKGGKNVKLTPKCKGKRKNDCPSSLDKEAVMCQYLMAERFVKSILQWKCPIPVEEFQDIAAIILRRLSFVLEYTPIDGLQDLKSQQMRFLADIIACWISGVLFEVAEEHKKEIEEDMMNDAEEEEEEEEDDDDEIEEPKKSDKEPEEDDEEEKEKDKEVVQEKESDDQESGNQGVQDDAEAEKPQEQQLTIKPEPVDEDEISAQLAALENAKREAEEREKARLEAEEKRKREEEEEMARKEAEEMARLQAEEEARLEAEEKARLEAEMKKQKEIEEAEENEARLKAELEEEKKRKEAEEEEERKKKIEEEEEEVRKKLEEEKKRKEREEEEEEKRKQEAELKKKKAEEEEEEEKLKEIGPQNAIDKIGDGELFKTDLPFVTFGKIFDTIYAMIEDEPEGDETDIIHNRIQRALYEKFAHLVELEAPDTLTENLKDVVDVLSGKTATWIKRLLKDSELKFINSYPPEVESKEIRDWGKWIDQVTDRAGDWAEWIHRVVNEAEDKHDGNVNRGDWQNWTSDTETKALLWRRYYLETVHQAHHNKMMITDRPVVKTGDKNFHSIPEEELIRDSDLAV